MHRRYFVTGTDTEVGKTVATCQLLRAFAAHGLKAVAMKPVASGCEWRDGVLYSEDVAAHAAAASVGAPLAWTSPYRFAPPIAPHIAAAEAGVQIDPAHLHACADHLAGLADIVLVEGAGGWYAPLTDTLSMADLAARLDCAVLLVVGMRLGCINHARLSMEAILSRGLPVAGWLANRIDPQMARYDENLALLRRMLPAPLLAEIAHSSVAERGSLPASAVLTLLP
ncbi:dethiobiotin synthase [Chitiniphilus purpureus]|uniref:ATP-dependent dethiobiotin synthetase BioD n=1 Tax=Chitiniphilus purpureus TaxID=2981137 RepID=A0ABY6DQX7_9NEIS|nr:dethiobiotin synthase [Chitiniphilus sp. CD1]UXY16785.1 dethiobiotin synthase [Chitiniphilus sp. CD1]